MEHDMSHGHSAPQVAPTAETPVKGNGANWQHQAPLSSVSLQTARTSGSHARSCRWCGAEIKGRRRNGFCSDRCRMRDTRAKRDQRLGMALKNAEKAFDVLRKELGRVARDNSEL